MRLPFRPNNLACRVRVARAQEIACNILVSLRTFLQKASSDSDGGPAAVNRSLAQALPFDVLVRVGDTHHANSGVVAPLCHCMNLQATVGLA